MVENARKCIFDPRNPAEPYFRTASLIIGTNIPLYDFSMRTPISTAVGVKITALVLSHRMGGAPEPSDISWPLSPLGTVSCTAKESKQRSRKAEEGEGGKREIIKPPHLW